MAADRASGLARLLAVTAAATLLAGCAVGGTAIPTSPPVAPADLTALHRTIDEINAAAVDPTAQRTALQRLVLPAHAEDQRRCPTTSNTVTLDPAWPSVRPVPGQPGVYLVPTLVRVHTDDRITGTDLTALVLTVESGRARPATLCVS